MKHPKSNRHVSETSNTQHLTDMIVRSLCSVSRAIATTAYSTKVSHIVSQSHKSCTCLTHATAADVTCFTISQCFSRKLHSSDTVIVSHMQWQQLSQVSPCLSRKLYLSHTCNGNSLQDRHMFHYVSCLLLFNACLLHVAHDA